MNRPFLRALLALACFFGPLGGAIATPAAQPHHASAKHYAVAKHAPAKATFNLSLLTPDQLADKVAAWAAGQAIPDLQQAIAVGTAAKENVVTPCWQALLTFAQAVNATAAANQANTTLNIHLATDIEIIAILQADLLPNGPLKIACAPAAQAFGLQTANLVGAIVAGGATSINTIVPAILPGL
ncbi:MAG TPA: hypothetical protein VLZ74_02600 [Methylocella sp.]|nr:hypothetical protein [Methylocella sp.]